MVERLSQAALVLVERVDHGGGHRTALVRVDVAIAHDGFGQVVAVEFDEGQVALMEEGELDGAVPEPVNEEGEGVEAHVGQTSPKPPVEGVLHQRHPGPVGPGEHEDEVAGASTAAAHVAKAVQGGHRTEEGTRRAG